MPDKLTLDLWSDIVCPWCWIAEHRLDRALKTAGLEADFRFHAYELGPRQQSREPVLQHLAQKYRVSLDEARQMTDRVKALGAELGLDINSDVQKTAATFDAHRLVVAAQGQGLGRSVMERLRRAHFSEGQDVSDHAVLTALAVEAGMEAAEARRVLASGAYSQEVEEDEQRAVAYEISGVPFTVVNMRVAVGGAQSEETFLKVFAKAQESPAEA